MQAESAQVAGLAAVAVDDDVVALVDVDRGKGVGVEATGDHGVHAEMMDAVDEPSAESVANGQKW